MASNREAEINRIAKIFREHIEKYDKIGRLSEKADFFTCFQCPEKQNCLGNKQYKISNKLAFALAKECVYIKYLIEKMRIEEQS